MTYKLKGSLQVPGDKSISHRSIMFGSLANGITKVSGFLLGADCLSTIRCFRQMGIAIDVNQDHVTIHGKGLHGLIAPDKVLDCGNSGTTTRLLSGILCGQEFTSTITGDDSIRNRPMGRIIKPLTLMGANIKSLQGNDKAPLCISPAALSGIHYQSPVASAQLKSAILLAGLYANGKTTVTEPELSRNHTEIMLRKFGAAVTSQGNTCEITKPDFLYGSDIQVPGDISSAAFFLAGASMMQGSELLLKHVGINPTRDGILRVLSLMGADMEIIPKNDNAASVQCTPDHYASQNPCEEPIADIRIRFAPLQGTVIGGSIIPTLIDEIPMIAAMATQASGTTIIKDAAELKVKESNRIRVMTEELTKLGADIQETEDGMIIHGGKKLHGGTIHSHKDHRIAMTFAILGLAIKEDITIVDKDCVDISYPDFYKDLNALVS